jgi:hypothetical protein
MRGLIAFVSLAVAFAACAAPGAGQGPESRASRAAAAVAMPDLPDVPIDRTLTPVSRSNPSEEAKAALDRCVKPEEMSLVVGMARLPSARDVRRYTLTNGNEPELQDEVPVWAVQLKGEVWYRFGTVFHPLCVVKNGEALLFAPYGGRHQDGSVWYPPADFTPPILALPPLAP